MKKIILYISVGVLVLLVGVYFLYRDTYFFEKGKASVGKHQYEKAFKYFGKIQNKLISLHNIGNTFVLSATELTQVEKTHKYEKALNAYSGALNIEENEDTRYNYEYVKNLLESMQQPQNNEEHIQNTPEEASQDASQQENEEKKEDDTSEESNPEQTNTPQETQEESTSQQQKTLSQERGERYQLQEDDAITKISPEELEYLEHHIDNLEQEQEENQKFYGKQEQSSSSDIFDEFFGTNSLFQKQLGSTQKDW